MAHTTQRYPYTREQAEQAIQEAVERWGGNEASGLSYRKAHAEIGKPTGGLIAFSYIESPRTPGAYKQIPYAS